MEKIAFISDGTYVYWSSIILTMAVATAIIFFSAMYLFKGGKIFAAAVTVPVAMVASIILSRLIHWYCRSDAYESMEAALTNYAQGNFALMGVFIGCILTAFVLRILRVEQNLPRMFDCMALGGGLGIAVGRLASLFNASDRGVILPDSVGFPFAYPVTNEVSGLVENRLATFMIQSMVTGGVVALLLLYLVVKKLMRKKVADGDICLIFLLCYGASQIVCDSTRYDSLFLRSNGFISVVQILGLVAVVIPIFVFSFLMVRNRGLKWYCFVLWVGLAGLMGLAGYMEYYVQRHGNEAVLAYSTMSGALVGIVLLTLIIRVIGRLPVKKEAIPEE